MKQTGIVVLIVALLAFGWWYAISSPEIPNTPEPSVHVTPTGTEYEVILTEEGYVPNELTIKKGDTIVFSNTTGRPFWPASNLHPSHRDYPEFDPREPILADETWSFTFGNVGTWRFHDHLAPYFTGVIIVEE